MWVLRLNDGGLLFALAAVHPHQQLSEFAFLAGGYWLLVFVARWMQIEKRADAAVLQAHIKMGERKMSTPSVPAVVRPSSLCLLNHHESTVQPAHSIVRVANLPCYVVQRPLLSH